MKSQIAIMSLIMVAFFLFFLLAFLLEYNEQNEKQRRQVAPGQWAFDAPTVEGSHVNKTKVAETGSVQRTKGLETW